MVGSKSSPVPPASFVVVITPRIHKAMKTALAAGDRSGRVPALTADGGKPRADNIGEGNSDRHDAADRYLRWRKWVQIIPALNGCRHNPR